MVNFNSIENTFDFYLVIKHNKLRDEKIYLLKNIVNIESIMHDFVPLISIYAFKKAYFKSFLKKWS